ncbi:phage terminase small subunit P27 family [Staphylococcus pseudoxylosus]|uniref:phage terminase small subunit P27 family n=1 Tax=Staphylococcus pseudoxylosus TaxID=2282419 RepID=UPI00398B5A53
MAKTSKLLSQTNKHYSKEEKELKKEAEKALKDLQKIELKPPEWLDVTTKNEYHRIVPLLRELPVASLDLALVSSYCQAYSDYQRATVELTKGEIVTFTERGSKVNPWHTVKRDSFNVMNSIAPKLGMTIDSRLKIFTPKANNDKDDDPFMDFFNK